MIGAEPLARLVLRNESLTTLLRLAALSAGAMILLECFRGLFIGQQKFSASLVLSIILGLGLLLTLPLAANLSAKAMVGTQAGIALLAVLVCLLLVRLFGISPLPSTSKDASGPNVSSVFMFGLIQLSTVFGINVASWWIASLVVRGDASLVQMGVYAIANQFRGIASLGPGLLTQTSYPLLTDESGREYGGANRVMLINTFLTTCFTLAVAGTLISALPWVLRHLYGKSFAAGELPAALLLATTIIHMSGVPASSRLSIVALRFVGIINGAWALIMILFGFLLVPRAGATGAAATWLLAHISSQMMVLLALKRTGNLPRGMMLVSMTATVEALMLAGLAYRRSVDSLHGLSLTLMILMTLFLLLCFLAYRGFKEGWLPRRINKNTLFSLLRPQGRSSN
jgi:O-antigen/teichoic acid export membrane protein